MRFSKIILGVCALAGATPAFAQEETAPAPEITVSGSAAVVSDYRFRGISQTDGNFAVQAGITVSHASGFYASVWGSSVDDYVTVHGTAHQEIDLIAGFKTTSGGVTFDIGAVYYLYPGTRPGFTGDVSKSSIIEPYAAVSYGIGPVTAKATFAYAPKQTSLALDQGQLGLPKQDNAYLAGDLSTSIPNTPISLSAHLGHTWGPSWLGIGNEYTDWSLGASATWKSLTFGVQYVDTDGDYITPSGKNASKGSVIGSVSVSF
jgi:uncharacterized protein (TIGR02001 family)